MRRGETGTRLARLVAVVILLGAGGARAEGQGSPADYPATAVPFTDVTFSDAFWAPRIETVRSVTLKAAFRQSEETGRIKNFEIAGGLAEGAFCTRYSFDDSDVFKIIEGAGYALATKKDPELEQYVDGLIAKIAKAQEPDGYLFTARTISPAAPIAMAGKARWVNLQHSHELYNLGHLYEAAVAYYQGTGKRALLDVALKSAELVVREFGPSKRRAVPGHQEIEIGLVKLFRLTGDRRYLDQAFFFLDQRGRPDRGELYGEYAQDHKPVAEQTEAVGHSVRAAYMYSAMADVGVLTRNRAYLSALNRLWENVVSKKLYLTGGIGATGAWEGFGPDYDLPNSAYAETCASIANALWNHRMFLIEQDARYIDIYERAVYNAMLSGLSLGGDQFFYPNPLLSVGQHQRSPWFACACCPSNLPRFILSMPGHAYAVAGDRLFVNLFVEGRATASLGGRKVEIDQQTQYPWDGDVRLRVRPSSTGVFSLRLRIPGWAREQPVPGDLYRDLAPDAASPVIRVNGSVVKWDAERGYAVLTREWRAGDEVQLSLPMRVRRVVAHPAVKANTGRVAIERGPLVYASEFADNGGHVLNLVLDDKTPLEATRRPDLLGGIVTLSGPATAYRMANGTPMGSNTSLTLIPYHAWSHRGAGEMQVWLARDAAKAKPVPEPTLASASSASSSEGGKTLEGLNDQIEPEHSNDHEARYFHWWPKKASLEWVQYEFKAPSTVSEVSVYWFDDTGQGGCRIPKGWRVLYRAGDRWLPVETEGNYTTDKDRYNTVRFAPVTTTAVRLEVQLPDEFSAGIQEWKVR
jgi:hypothetical protein